MSLARNFEVRGEHSQRKLFYSVPQDDCMSIYGTFEGLSVKFAATDISVKFSRWNINVYFTSSSIKARMVPSLHEYLVLHYGKAAI
jgi:hypothetical protein